MVVLIKSSRNGLHHHSSAVPTTNDYSWSKKQLLLKLNTSLPAILLLHLLCSKTQATNLPVIDIDLIKAIAKDQGFEIEITNPGFDAAISAVQAGQADGIIAGMSVTDARKATLTSSESYYTAKYYPWCKDQYHCFL